MVNYSVNRFKCDIKQFGDLLIPLSTPVYNLLLFSLYYFIINILILRKIDRNHRSFWQVHEHQSSIRQFNQEYTIKHAKIQKSEPVKGAWTNQ